MLVEECAELIVAVNHYDRGKITIEDLFSEVADVEIMIGQMKTWIEDTTVNFEKIKQEKLERLQLLLRGDKDGL